MPQQQPTVYRTDLNKPFQIAKGPSNGTPQVSEGEAAGHSTEKSEGHHPGEIPSAQMLFGNSLLVAIIMIAFAVYVKSKLQEVPKGLANFAEFVAEALNDFTLGIVGPGGQRYTPLVGTVFIYILLANLIGIIPGFHSPTGNITITLALGVVVFCYVQYEGIRQSGLGGYLKHFAGPMWALSPLLFPIEVISELIKPFTLAVRLFGNIFGEDVILVVLAGLVMGVVPIHFPVLFLSLITAVVQALVFSILTCIYLSLMSHHGHDEHHDEAHGAAAAHAASH